MKKIILAIIAGFGIIGMSIGYIMVPTSAFLFVGLLLAKLIGLGDIQWFALTSVSVFITPIYAILLGIIGFIISMLVTALAVDEIE